MPGMDVASASVAFIQFSVSTAQAIKQLHDFIQAIRDAPKTVKKLADEVALLGRIIEEVRNGGDSVGGIPAPTLEMFNMAEQEVRGLVERLHSKLIRTLPHMSDTSRKRFIKSLRSVLSKDEVTGHFAVIERAKTSLLIAQGALQLQWSQGTRRQLQSLSNDQRLISSASASGSVVIQCVNQTLSIDNSTKYEISAKDIHNRRNEQGPEAEPYTANSGFSTDLKKFVSNQTLGPKQAQILEFYLGKALEYVAEQDRQMDAESIVRPQVDSTIPRYTKVVPQETSGASSPFLGASRRRPSDYSFSSSGPVWTTTVYDHPWIGKIVVRRKAKHTKQWNPEDGTLERLREEHITTLELKLAPWLAIPFASIELQTQRLQLINDAPTFGFKLPKSFPYFRMPPELGNAIEAGNLEALQQAVSDNVIPLSGRDHSGRNLLDMSLETFGDDYVNLAFDPPSHIGSLLKMARWLYSQGIKTDMDDKHFILANHIYLSACNSGRNVAANTFHMEQLLIDVTADAPAIPRAKTLLHFAILNSEHSIYLESVISDIIDDAISVDKNHCAQDLTKLDRDLTDLRARWEPIHAKYGGYPVGVEHMLLSSWIRLRRLSKLAGDDMFVSAERFRHLKGPRYILLKTLLMFAEPYLSGLDVIESIANWLRLCRRYTPTILEDGFGDFLSKIACRSNLLGMWHEILDSAGFSASEFISRHITVHERMQQPLRVQLTLTTDADLANPSSVVLTARDPHDLVEMQFWEQRNKPQERFLFNSHETLLPPEFCVVRQAGSELYFDCGVADPLFENASDWDSERAYFDDVEEKMEYYTEEDAFADSAELNEQTSLDQSKSGGLLSHLVSGGASVLSSIV